MRVQLSRAIWDVTSHGRAGKRKTQVLTLPPAESSGEEDISTQQNRAQASSRLSRAHRDRGRPQGHRCAARPWPQALVGLSKVVKPPFGRADKMTDDASGGPFPSLAPPERLRRRSDYLRAAQSGQSRQSRAFKLQMAMRDEKSLGAPRFGFTVTKKVAGAVGRNRIRRRLKEALRVPAPLPLVLAETTCSSPAGRPLRSRFPTL